ncbi:MAG: hypothetical protein WBQ76_14720 [Candidatus Korobacteraceae bacterium]
MPETAVHKDTDMPTRKDNIRGTAHVINRPDVLLKPKPGFAQRDA